MPQPAHDLVGGTSLGGMESNFGMVRFNFSPSSHSTCGSFRLESPALMLQQDFGAMDMNPLGSTDVLNDFDFDSFLNDGDNGNEDFVFTGGYSGMEGGEIGAE